MDKEINTLDDWLKEYATNEGCTTIEELEMAWNFQQEKIDNLKSKLETISILALKSDEIGRLNYEYDKLLEAYNKTAKDHNDLQEENRSLKKEIEFLESYTPF